jgi:hypothetical protein
MPQSLLALRQFPDGPTAMLIQSPATNPSQLARKAGPDPDRHFGLLWIVIGSMIGGSVHDP